MNSIKMKARALLKGRRGKIYLISLLSFALRWGIIPLNILNLYKLSQSRFIDLLLKEYNDAFVYGAFLFGAVLVIFGKLLFISALRSFELKYYFKFAAGTELELKTVFKQLNPRHSFPQFLLYLRLFLLKAGWTVFFLLPFLFCVAMIYYLYSAGTLNDPQLIILLSGNVLIGLAGAEMAKNAKNRYRAAPLFLKNKKTAAKTAVFKSILVCDALLRKFRRLSASFFFLFLLCIFIFPLFLILPYYRICSALIILESGATSAYKAAP